MHKKYDFIIVGCGLYGAAMANRIKAAGYRCLILEKRNHLAGNAYTEELADIHIHKFGAHIFHTSNKEVWSFVNRYANFNRYTNSPIANYHGEIYNLPFNMNTFNKMWGVITPDQARAKISEQQDASYVAQPKNLEEQAVNLVGRDIYEKLIRGYTEKQWGRPCTQLPSFIIKRLPVRFTYDNNYFNDTFQGIPIHGYTALVKKMIEGIEVKYDTDFLRGVSHWTSSAKKVIYTGPIDAFYGYRFGTLQYRSLRFETEILNTPNYQGNAVVNYTDFEIPYTRIIEHKHFLFGEQRHTVISREYSIDWKQGDEPYYPINDDDNNRLFNRYWDLAQRDKKILFGGRLGEYKYYDMDKVIAAALERSSPTTLKVMLSEP